MKRVCLLAALILPAFVSCSIMGPAFTGLLQDPAPQVGGIIPDGKHLTPAEDPATGLYGYLNDWGMWAIRPQFEGVQTFRSSGMARVRIGHRYGAINTLGQLVIPAVFSSGSNIYAAIESIEKGRLAGIELWAEEDPQTGLFGYLDHFGRWAIAPQFPSCRNFGQNRLAIVQVADGHWGAIDMQGNMVIQPRFKSSSDAQTAAQRLGRP